MYATWVIRGFEKRGDKLVAEHSIGQVPLADVQKALQISSEDPMYDSYRLGPAEVLRLKDFIPQTLDFGELEYFLERE